MSHAITSAAGQASNTSTRTPDARQRGDWIIVNPDATKVYATWLDDRTETVPVDKHVVGSAEIVRSAQSFALHAVGFNRYLTAVYLWADPFSPLTARPINFLAVDKTPSSCVSRLLPTPGMTTHQTPSLETGSPSWERIAIIPPLTGSVPYLAATPDVELASIRTRLRSLQDSFVTLTDWQPDFATSVAKALTEFENVVVSYSQRLAEAAGRPPMAEPVVDTEPTAPPELAEIPNKAVKAAADLQSWLNLNLDEVAAITGTSKSSILYWKRQNALPRPGTARNLYHVHALVRALMAATYPDPPLVRLKATSSGSPIAALDLLLQGKVDEAERLLRPILFAYKPGATRMDRLPSLEGDSIDPPVATGLALKTPTRHARRVKLQGPRE